jgi:hypothetical protein
MFEHKEISLENSKTEKKNTEKQKSKNYVTPTKLLIMYSGNNNKRNRRNI